MTERVSDAPNDSVETIFAAARGAGRTLLSEVEAKAALGAAGVPVTPTRAASSAAEAAAIADANVAQKVSEAGNWRTDTLDRFRVVLTEAGYQPNF